MPWLEYYIGTFAEVFEAVKIWAQKCAENGRQENVFIIDNDLL